MRMIYTAALTPQENSSGYYARIPDVPGCVTTGRDLPETLDNIQDALAGCLCVLEDERQPLPAPRPPEAFEDEPGVVHALISPGGVHREAGYGVHHRALPAASRRRRCYPRPRRRLRRNGARLRAE